MHIEIKLKGRKMKNILLCILLIEMFDIKQSNFKELYLILNYLILFRFQWLP